VAKYTIKGIVMWGSKPPRTVAAIVEILRHCKSRLDGLRRENEEYRDNEVSREYPRDDRVEKYEARINLIHRVSQQLDKTLKRLRELDNKIEVRRVRTDWPVRPPRSAMGICRVIEIIADVLKTTATDLKKRKELNKDEVERGKLEVKAYLADELGNIINRAASELGNWKR